MLGTVNEPNQTMPCRSLYYPDLTMGAKLAGQTEQTTCLQLCSAFNISVSVSQNVKKAIRLVVFAADKSVDTVLL